MEEIAATFDSIGVPDGFHAASADIYTRLSGYKSSEMPDIEDVLATLLKGDLV